MSRISKINIIPRHYKHTGILRPGFLLSLLQVNASNLLAGVWIRRGCLAKCEAMLIDLVGAALKPKSQGKPFIYILQQAVGHKYNSMVLLILGFSDL
jgi:hypothetical protein